MINRALGNYRFGFNGKEEDGETGYTNFEFRTYEGALGRFFMVDPLSTPFETPYAFAGNDPINYIDWLGLKKGNTRAQRRDNLAVYEGNNTMQKIGDFFNNLGSKLANAISSGIDLITSAINKNNTHSDHILLPTALHAYTRFDRIG